MYTRLWLVCLLWFFVAITSASHTAHKGKVLERREVLEWTKRNPYLTSKQIVNMAHSPVTGQYAFIGGVEEGQSGVYPEILISTDLVQWSLLEVPVRTTSGYAHIVWSPSVGFLASFSDPESDMTVYYTSQNGVEWSENMIDFAFNILIVGGGMIVAAESPMPVLGDALIRITWDGNNWDDYTLPLIGAGPFDITYMNASFWLYGYDIPTEYSTGVFVTDDFIDWKPVVVTQAGQRVYGISKSVDRDRKSYVVAAVGAKNSPSTLTFYQKEKLDIDWWSKLGTAYLKDNTLYGPGRYLQEVYGGQQNISILNLGLWSWTTDFRIFQPAGIPLNITHYATSIEMENNTFFMLGHYGLMARSRGDLMGWDVVPEGITSDLVTVLYHNVSRSFVMPTLGAQTNDAVLVSENGYVWKILQSNFPIEYLYQSTVRGELIGYNQDTIVWTKDLKKWSVYKPKSVQNLKQIHGVAIGENAWVFIATVKNNEKLNGFIVTSTDQGKNWFITRSESSKKSSIDQLSLFYGSIVYGKGNFFALSLANKEVLKSSDGINWKPIPGDAYHCNYGKNSKLISANDEVFFLCENNVHQFYFGKWLIIFSESMLSISYSFDKRMFIGSGYNGTIYFSTSAVTWTEGEPVCSEMSAADFTSIAYGRHVWIAVGGYPEFQSNMLYIADHRVKQKSSVKMKFPKFKWKPMEVQDTPTREQTP